MTLPCTLGSAIPWEAGPSSAVAGSPLDLAHTQAVEGSRAVARNPVVAGTAALADTGNIVVAAGMDSVVHTAAAAHIAIDMAAMALAAEAAYT